eukprot:TRINITY_DN6123_c0_g1_i5.p1 TRINITY_DN6123_c0_g1~~TRINITY_DN6123_c0_g1_i5.p1  ORF type:complete len:249 (+),score=45.70 TRINITY_DN6123_c0_g1_i5:51-797(+)
MMIRNIEVSLNSFPRSTLKMELLASTSLSSGLFGVALVGGIYYYFYQTFRNIANDVLHGKIGDGANILIASSAGALTALLNNPVWIVNTRLMLEQKKSESKRTSTLDAAKKIFQEEGIAGFWAGIIPALILVSNPTIQYVVFERLKRNLSRGRSLTPNMVFLLGAISKAIATVATYPYLVIKTRLQAKSDSYNGTWHALTEMLQTEGISGFYKGISSKILQSVLNAALMFMLQDQLVKLILRSKILTQ